MKTSLSSRPLPGALLRSLLWVWLFCCIVVVVAHSQSPCPEENNRPNFAEGETYYVDIDVRFRGTPTGAQIEQAFNDWTNANARNNGSNVRFVVFNSWSEVPPGANLIHVSQKSILGDMLEPQWHVRARIESVRVEGATLREATIFFNTNALADPTNPSSGPFYNPDLPGYNSVYAKATRHEVGHGMGLDEPLAQQPRGSVMNGSATCANDNCNFLPDAITDCDNQKVNEVYAAPPPGTCIDNDGDGFTTCDGDPDDNNPFLVPATAVYSIEMCIGYGCVQIDHYVVYPNGTIRFWYSETVCSTWMMWC